MGFLTPPPMGPGDRVAVVAPLSGGAREAPHVLALTLSRLHEVFGLEPVVFPTARQRNGFFGEHPRARAADLHAAFCDSSITGVFATIGGWDALRILEFLNLDRLRAIPTRFFGTSDNTNVSLALRTSGLVSYNGAQLMSELAVPGELHAYTERYCRRAFFQESLGPLEPSAEWTDEPSTEWTNPEELERSRSTSRTPGGAGRVATTPRPGGSGAAVGRSSSGSSRSIGTCQIPTTSTARCSHSRPQTTSRDPKTSPRRSSVWANGGCWRGSRPCSSADRPVGATCESRRAKSARGLPRTALRVDRLRGGTLRSDRTGRSRAGRGPHDADRAAPDR